MTPHQRHHRAQFSPRKRTLPWMPYPREKKMNILQTMQMKKVRKTLKVNLFLTLQDIVSSHQRRFPALSQRCRLTCIGAQERLKWKQLQVSLASMHTSLDRFRCHAIKKMKQKSSHWKKLRNCDVKEDI